MISNFVLSALIYIQNSNLQLFVDKVASGGRDRSAKLVSQTCSRHHYQSSSDGNQQNRESIGNTV